MERVIYRCMTKATDREGDVIRASFNSLFARRGELRLTGHAIECGDWTIAYAEIDDAVLLTISMRMWWVFRWTAYTLKIKARGKTYLFQLPFISLWRSIIDPFWFGETPLPLRDEVTYYDWEASKPTLTLVVLWIYLTMTACLALLFSL
jgi:hypothetical protein